MGWVTEGVVGGDVRGEVVGAWTARTTGEHRLVPDACVDVLWLANGTAWVCGPETSAWTFTLPPGTDAVGVRLRAGRAATVLGFDTAEVLNRRVAVEDVLGARAQRLLVEQIGDCTGPAARLRTIQDHARRWLDRAAAPDRVADTIVRSLRADLTVSVAELAAATALSERQLHRRCVAAFGYGPATLRRILRLQRFLRLARHPAAPTDLARLAGAAQYTDQSHLYRDCRLIAGTTPRALIAPPAATEPAATEPLGAQMSDRYTTATPRWRKLTA